MTCAPIGRPKRNARSPDRFTPAGNIEVAKRRRKERAKRSEEDQFLPAK
ncbi:unnamed protein product, partial [Cuscuta europaea]